MPLCIVDGIDLSGATDILNIMTGLSNVNANSELECLSMRRCSIANIMLTNANYLQGLITSTTSKLVHIHLDQNDMDTINVNTFVTNTLNGATLIPTLKRVFIQFQTTPVSGAPLPAPTAATLTDWTTATNPLLPLLQINANNEVTNGQYDQALGVINNINNAFTTPINGINIPIFVVNGFNIANLYQAWVEIPVGSNNFHVGSSSYPYPIPANWTEPGVFNHNNPTPVFGKIIN